MRKILVSIDDRLPGRLYHEAAAQGISTSALIARLTAAALGEPIGLGANPEVHARLNRLKALFRGVHAEVESTHVTREMRDSR